ncbi:hypothetical protein [Streptosporangium sp. NPDC087985]|uniref:hypothetical protein n=1 Tax=Streptosporangium sp. NPDC087985 TaxID=3366196 RepID=UPI00380E104E
MTGQPRDLMLRLHGAEPTEEELAGWMRDGAVIRLEVSEAGSHQMPYSMLVNFSSVAFAWIVPLRPGRRVTF